VSGGVGSRPGRPGDADPAWPRITRRATLAAAAGGAGALALPRTARARPRSTDARTRLPAAASINAANPADLSAVEAAALLQARRLSSRELTRACLDRIHARQPVLNAWVRTYPELALRQADAADRRLARARRGSPAPHTCGIPIGLKDLYAVEGLPLTASSRVLDGNVATGDSTVWARLRRAGMVLLGHAHTDEFAFGVGTPQTGNPWDPGRSPGGSSGGSGSAVGARMTPLATGTDTGGSLRSPASACGISSIKPTFGLVSAYGVIPLVWSRDHPGPMARSAADCALLLSYMAGRDPDDGASLAVPLPPALYPLAAGVSARPFAGRRFGVAPNAGAGLPAGTAPLWATFLDQVRALGGEVVEVAEPTAPPGVTGDIGEVWSYHQQFGPAALPKYRAEIAAVLTAAHAAAALPMLDYLTFQRARLMYARRWQEHFGTHRLDAVVKPGTTIDGATRRDLAGITVFSESVGGDYGWANFAGLPVAATPVGRSRATGMPFGVQIGAPPHRETALLQLVLDYQAHHPAWHEAPKGLPG
jgi:aspartyl-tRNA(Asn)/glutamyl-tRNA(Gln) amidotransferase subunit A